MSVPQTPSTNTSSIALRIQGREASMPIADVRGLFIERTRAAMASHHERLRRFVEWGVLLTDVRPKIKGTTFAQWLRDGGCNHRQIAYSAINIAKELAGTDGSLSPEAWAKTVEAYNAKAAELKYKPLDAMMPTVLAARIATGQRPGTPLAQTSTAPIVRARGQSEGQPAKVAHGQLLSEGQPAPNAAPESTGWELPSSDEIEAAIDEWGLSGRLAEPVKVRKHQPHAERGGTQGSQSTRLGEAGHPKAEQMQLEVIYRRAERTQALAAMVRADGLTAAQSMVLDRLLDECRVDAGALTGGR